MSSSSFEHFFLSHVCCYLVCHRSFEGIMTKRVERPTVLLEEIDNAIRDVGFECFVQSCYGSTMSPSKSSTH